MVNTKKIITAVFILAAAATALILFSDSEEERIKKRLQRLGETIQKDPGETQLPAAKKAGKVKDYFTESSRIQIPAYNFSRDVTRKNLPGYVLQARSYYTSLEVDFKDFTIVFPAEYQAELSVTVMVKGRGPSGEYTRDVQELSCRLQKIENEWFIQEIEIVQVLEK